MDVKHFEFTDMHGAKYEPWSNGQAVGFKVTRCDGFVEYVYLNPSSEDSEGQSNVFFYQGQDADPATDAPVCFQCLFV